MVKKRYNFLKYFFNLVNIASSEIIEILTKKPVTMNNHIKGITPEDFQCNFFLLKKIKNFL